MRFWPRVSAEAATRLQTTRRHDRRAAARAGGSRCRAMSDYLWRLAIRLASFALEHKRSQRIWISIPATFRNPFFLRTLCEATFRMRNPDVGCTDLQRSPFRRLAIAQNCGSGEPPLGSRTL